MSRYSERLGDGIVTVLGGTGGGLGLPVSLRLEFAEIDEPDT